MPNNDLLDGEDLEFLFTLAAQIVTRERERLVRIIQKIQHLAESQLSQEDTEETLKRLAPYLMQDRNILQSLTTHCLSSGFELSFIKTLVKTEFLHRNLREWNNTH